MSSTHAAKTAARLAAVFARNRPTVGGFIAARDALEALSLCNRWSAAALTLTNGGRDGTDPDDRTTREAQIARAERMQAKTRAALVKFARAYGVKFENTGGGLYLNAKTASGEIITWNA